MANRYVQKGGGEQLWNAGTGVADVEKRSIEVRLQTSMTPFDSERMQFVTLARGLLPRPQATGRKGRK